MLPSPPAAFQSPLVVPPSAFALLRRFRTAGPQSREALSRALNLGDAELEAGLQALAAQGVAIRRAGDLFVVADPVDLLDAAALEADLRARGSALSAEVLDQCASTNARLLEAPFVHGRVLACELQTAGRGRRGNGWHARLGASLTFSMAWRIALPPQALGGLTLAVAVACARALEALGFGDVRLKWPNDLMRNGAKLGGILVEVARSAGDRTELVIGVGLNVRADAALQAQVGRPLADLHTGDGTPPSRTALLAGLLRELESALQRYEREGFAAFFKNEWLRRHAYQDRRVRMAVNERESVEGWARDVAEDGALVLQTETGLHRFHAGEVSLREAA